MKRICFSIVSVFTITSGLYAQTVSNPLSADIKQAYEAVKKNLLGAADKMPEADYNFKPTPEIRGFGEVMQHVAMAQSHTCGAVAGNSGAQMPAADGKAAIIAALKQSFTECDKAYDSLTDANAAEMIKSPRGQKTRLGMLAGNTTHDTEQYAILSVYLRLKGIVPPSSSH